MIGEYKRYDVVLIDFGENTIGSEQGGIRPAIIIQNNILFSFILFFIFPPFVHM